MVNDYDTQALACLDVLESFKANLMITAGELLLLSGVQINVEQIIENIHCDESMTTEELIEPLIGYLKNACVLCGEAKKATQERDFHMAMQCLHYAAAINTNIRLIIMQRSFANNESLRNLESVLLPTLKQDLADTNKDLDKLAGSVAILPARIKEGFKRVGIATAQKVRSIAGTNNVKKRHQVSGRSEAYALMYEEWEYWQQNPKAYRNQEMFIAEVMEKFKATHKKTGVVKPIGYSTIEKLIGKWKKQRAPES
jgi:hypothetical protein